MSIWVFLVKLADAFTVEMIVGKGIFINENGIKQKYNEVPKYCRGAVPKSTFLKKVFKAETVTQVLSWTGVGNASNVMCNAWKRRFHWQSTMFISHLLSLGVCGLTIGVMVIGREQKCRAWELRADLALETRV